jgi:3-oxoacyl-[acyl-carrier protein] reductase
MKNIVIIGAGKGIGLKTAELLAKDNIVFAFSNSITPELNEITNHVFEFNSLKSDLIASFEQLPEIIDVLIYTPGSIRLKPFNRISKEEYIEDLDQNVLGAIEIIKALLPRLKRSNQASIVLFSSVAAQVGMTFHASVSISKAAVEGLTRSLAAEFAPNIRVNCIAPSLTNTSLAVKLLSSDEKIEASNQRHPLKRIGKVEDIAKMVSFLASDDSSWITGQVFGVDGGMSSIK